MRPRLPSACIVLMLMTGGAGQVSAADPDRSAAIPQVTRGATLAERSAAGFEQIATVEAGRSKVEQIDPALAVRIEPEADRLLPGAAPPPPEAGCRLTPDQQAIVTSLEAQGKLPAGDCEMVAWFARPGDKSENEERAALSVAVAGAAPELLGREGEAEAAARLAAEQRAAADVTVSTTIFTPAPAGD